jgi:transcriptional regulator with XRE-family HTH domain
MTTERGTVVWTVRSGEDLGRAIAEIRHERGLTQAQLAEAVGVSRGYLAQLETGKSGRLLNLLVRLLRRLGADITVSFRAGDGVAGRVTDHVVGKHEHERT